MNVLIIPRVGLAAAALVVGAFHAHAGDSSHPLAPMERLVGTWSAADGVRQDFEWGVGKRALRTRMYFVAEAGPKLVSEGVWYWHPGADVARATVVAVDMPVDLFEYETRFEADRFVSSLLAHGPDGPRSYVEVWEFVGDDAYTWSLFEGEGDSRRKLMGGRFERVASGDAR